MHDDFERRILHIKLRKDSSYSVQKHVIEVKSVCVMSSVYSDKVVKQNVRKYVCTYAHTYINTSE